MSDAELIERSDLVVVGSWVGQSPVALAGTPTVRALGSIAVSEVVKGDPRRTVVLVVVPPADLPRTSDSIAYRPGDRGLWLLRKADDTGLYLADHPQRFLPAGAADSQIKALRKLIGNP